MLLIYKSLTGNVRDFVNKTGYKSIEANRNTEPFLINENYLVVVPSYDSTLPEEILNLIEYKDNIKYLKGFAGSGNRNFGKLYCYVAKELARKYNKPLVHTFEFMGIESDVQIFKERVEEIEST